MKNAIVASCWTYFTTLKLNLGYSCLRHEGVHHILVEMLVILMCE